MKSSRKEKPFSIFEYPKSIEQHEKADRIFLGDMHGNTFLAIHFLLREGVLTVNPPAENQEKVMSDLEKLYKKVDFSRNDMEDFFRILNEQFVLRDPESTPTVIFIGDMLADRGANDILTLLLLKKLQLAGCKFEIVISNHDDVFLNWFMKLMVEGDATFNGKLVEEQDHSLKTLSKMILNKNLSQEEAVNLVKDFYLPHLKLATGYIYSDKLGNKTLDFAQHATGYDAIKLLVRDFNKLFTDLEIPFPGNQPFAFYNNTLEGFLATVNSLNEGFRSILCCDNPKKIAEFYQVLSNMRMNENSGFYALTWKRDEDDSYKTLPQKNPVNVYRGHESSGSDTFNNIKIINLDGKIGKEIRATIEGKFYVKYNERYDEDHFKRISSSRKVSDILEEKNDISLNSVIFAVEKEFSVLDSLYNYYSRDVEDMIKAGYVFDSPRLVDQRDFFIKEIDSLHSDFIKKGESGFESFKEKTDNLISFIQEKNIEVVEEKNKLREAIGQPWIDFLKQGRIQAVKKQDILNMIADDSIPVYKLHDKISGHFELAAYKLAESVGENFSELNLRYSLPDNPSGFFNKKASSSLPEWEKIMGFVKSQEIIQGDEEEKPIHGKN